MPLLGVLSVAIEQLFHCLESNSQHSEGGALVQKAYKCLFALSLEFLFYDDFAHIGR
jgi:hypothetical protein